MKKLLIILVLFIANSSFAQEVRDHRSDDNKKPYTPSPLKPPSPAAQKQIGPPGSLYDRFATGGILVTGSSATTFDKILVYHNGKVFTVEESKISGAQRTILNLYNTDGTPDKSFGKNGTVILNGVSLSDYALQQNGKIIGVNRNSGEVFKFSEDGRTDNIFKLSIPGYPFIKLESVAIDHHGKIVVAGNVFAGHPTDPYRLLVARLNADGTYDETFGPGFRIVVASDGSRTGKLVAIMPDNKIVVAVDNMLDGNDIKSESYLIRFNVDGSQDKNFGNKGKYRLGRKVAALETDATGKIMVVSEGVRLLDANASSSIIIYSSPDGVNAPFMNAALIQKDDNKILISGVALSKPDQRDVWIRRYNSDGSADRSFGKNGYVTTDLNINSNVRDVFYANHVIYVAGYVNNKNGNFGLVLAYDGSSKPTATATKLPGFTDTPVTTTKPVDVNPYIGETEKNLTATTKLTEGTTFKDGKIMIGKGYHASYADNNQVVVVQRMSNGITVGTFTCSCTNSTGPGDCLPTLKGEFIACSPIGSCNHCQPLLFPGTPPKGTVIAKSTLKWQKLILPTSTKQ